MSTPASGPRDSVPKVDSSRETVIHADAIVKVYGHTRALDGLDLEVRKGEVHAFLGPNGAGKTTTIRALLGLINLDGGNLTVFGLDPVRDATEVHRRLAYVPGDVAVWPNLTGGETIDLLIRMRGADPHGPSSRRKEMIERFNLNPTKKGRAYSTGNRQKIALIAALCSPTDLLLLDEPTTGLDPLMKQVFNEYLAELNSEGTTVLISSHILSEVERLAETVTIIRDGMTIETGAIEDLRHLSRTKIHATVTGPIPDLTRVRGAHDVVVDGTQIECSVDATELSSVLSALAQAGVQSLTSSPPTLEDLFLDVYRSDSPATDR